MRSSKHCLMRPALEELDDRCLLSGVGTSLPATPSPAVTAEIDKVYQHILSRAPDSSGFDAAVNAIANGTTSGQLASELLHSPEHQQIEVVHDYQGDLGRTPDPAEINAGVAALQGGETNTELDTGLIDSTEFNLDHPNSADFVQPAYQAALGRAASSADTAAVLSELNSGTSREAIVGSLVGSAEADINTIETDYQDILGRSADAAGEQAALNGMQDGSLDSASLDTSLVASTEFESETG